MRNLQKAKQAPDLIFLDQYPEFLCLKPQSGMPTQCSDMHWPNLSRPVWGTTESKTNPHNSFNLFEVLIETTYFMASQLKNQHAQTSSYLEVWVWYALYTKRSPQTKWNICSLRDESVTTCIIFTRNKLPGWFSAEWDSSIPERTIRIWLWLSDHLTRSNERHVDGG